MDYSKIAQTLDSLLGNIQLDTITEEGVKFKFPDGYYLSQVVKAELTESKSGNPMVAIEYLTIEDGKKVVLDEEGYSQLVDAKGTGNKKIYVNYVLTNETNVGYFIADMMKFKDPETDTSFFSEEDFKTAEGIVNVCERLTQGGIIYLVAQNIAKKDNPKELYTNFKPITWKKATQLELI